MLPGDAVTTRNPGPDDQLESSIEPVFGLMTAKRLSIPAYQRPYTWTTKNASDLVSDINRFRAAGHYRIGTFILHPAGDSVDIVDGQQRYLTFALIATALADLIEEDDDDLVSKLRSVTAGVSLPVRKDGRSEKNIRQNYGHIRQVFADWDRDDRRLFTEFFLNDCSVVVLQVRDLDAAFQMFDSQNTRGRALYPTDLLKAYHLREFSETAPSRDAVLETVREWEKVDPAEINHVIAEILYRIKLWSANRPIPRTGFTSHQIGLFKGIKEGRSGNGHFRWARQALLAKAAVDRFQHENATLLRHGVVAELEYPFLITEPVIDGEAFFQMVHHYVHQSRKAGVNWDQTSARTEAHADALDEVLEILDRMPSGAGNNYVRALFDCLVIAFTDRFGWRDAKAAGWALARHAYLLRVHLQRVQAGSVDIHARTVHHRIQTEDENLFAMIAQALDPDVILSRATPEVPLEDRHPEPLRTLFQRDERSKNKQELPA